MFKFGFLCVLNLGLLLVLTVSALPMKPQMRGSILITVLVCAFALAGATGLFLVFYNLDTWNQVQPLLSRPTPVWE
jgi:hypothetical protein